MDSNKPLILLTNDDGIFSEGLKVIEENLQEFGDLYVVAPDRERNAASHSISLKTSIYILAEGNNRFSCSGTPSDCVNIGVHRLLPRKPDLVISGINKGGNLAEDITYSGTVAAALEARMLHIPSMAVSLAMREDFNFVPAGRVVNNIARWLLDHELPPAVFLNVNIPDLDGVGVSEIRWTRMGHKVYSDFLEEGKDETGKPFYRFGLDDMRFVEDHEVAEADWRAVQQGYISITPLRLDMTDENHLNSLKNIHNKGICFG